MRLDNRRGTLQARILSVFGGLNDDPCGACFGSPACPPRGGTSCTALLSAVARSRTVFWSGPASATLLNSLKAARVLALIASYSKARWGSASLSRVSPLVSSGAGRRLRTEAAANSLMKEEGSRVSCWLIQNPRQ